jgi:hypothetical protein
MTNRQLDILATRADWFTLPRHVPGRLNAEDFVFFDWPRTLNNCRYTVVVEVLDNAGPTYRGIGKLQKSVELPHVQYDWHARIALVPDSTTMPVFESELNRGSTYVVPDVGKANGRFQMVSHGMKRPPGL